MPRLNIYNRRERMLVAAADAALRPAGLMRRALRRAPPDPPKRILCLRLERIGDLIMTIPALTELRALVPGAAIDLVVGSWNREIASTIHGIDRIETLDAAWLTREGDARTLLPLIREARSWRSRQYDLAINFEPDIRSNLVATAAGARRLAGFASGGGGALLDLALDYDQRAHTADNAVALVRAALAGSAPATGSSMLALPDSARAEAARLLRSLPDGVRIGIHVSGGRPVKQWPEARFAEIAARMVADRNAAIVLTGAPGDRAQVEIVKRELPSDRVLDLSGRVDLVTLAATLMEVDLLVTGDTGPMHLADAVGTPVVAIFGPSDAARYAPRGPRSRIVRIDLPCSPCNRIRLPPARCTGHTPDCLAGIPVAQVIHAIDDVLAEHDPVASASRRKDRYK
jgi:ADP-heptose:LPS heptosyltransferase